MFSYLPVLIGTFYILSIWMLSWYLGLIRCCLVNKMYRQALLWLCHHCWILWPAVCHVLWWAEPDHGGLYRNGECPALSNTQWFVVLLCSSNVWQQVSVLMQNYTSPPYPIPVIFLFSLWWVLKSEDWSKEASDGSAMVWLWLSMPQSFPGKL